MKTCQKWMSRIAPVLAVAMLTAGCVVHDHGYGYHRVYGPAVTIEAGHVHSADCGHYHHRSHWYYAPSHVHGPGCGHIVRGGIWIR